MGSKDKHHQNDATSVGEGCLSLLPGLGEHLSYFFGTDNLNDTEKHIFQNPEIERRTYFLFHPNPPPVVKNFLCRNYPPFRGRGSCVVMPLPFFDYNASYSGSWEFWRLILSKWIGRNWTYWIWYAKIYISHFENRECLLEELTIYFHCLCVCVLRHNNPN